MSTMLKNYWTTILGILAGVITYLQANGTSMPTDKQGWISLGLGAVLAAFGVASKDATTGSKPPGA